jgi:hypothetical protein
VTDETRRLLELGKQKKLTFRLYPSRSNLDDYTEITMYDAEMVQNEDGTITMKGGFIQDEFFQAIDERGERWLEAHPDWTREDIV